MIRIGWRKAAVTGVAIAAMGTQAAVAAPQACIPADQARGLVSFVLPTILREAGRICAPRLAAGAMLRDLPPRLMSRFEVDADAAWPQAQRAFASLTGITLGDSGAPLARPIMEAMAGPMVTSGLNPDDCEQINEIATALSPLPSANFARAVVALVQLRAQDPNIKSKGPPICRRGGE